MLGRSSRGRGTPVRVRTPGKGFRVQTGLQNAFILLRCTKKTHDDCRRIRDALVENSHGYVQEAYTTNTTIGDTTWCVAASALVPAEESEKFKRRIKTVRALGGRSVGVKKLKVMMDRR